MKKLSIVFLFLIFSNINGQIPQDYVGYYPLDTNANDFSINGFNGQSYNTQIVPGVFNNAYNFNGINSKVISSGDNRNITNVVTISAWIRTNAQNRYGFVVSKYDWRIDKGFHLAIWDNGHAFLAGRDTSNNYIMVLSLMPVNDGKWHHLLGIINGNTWKLWVDCELQDTVYSSASNPDLTNNEALAFGYYPLSDNGDHRYFEGDIDNIYLYNRELTQNEIQALCVRNPVAIETDNGNISEYNVMIYPNPTNNNIKITSNTLIQQVTIIDESGKTILSKKINTNSLNLILNQIDKGIYIVKIQLHGNHLIYKRIIKK